MESKRPQVVNLLGVIYIIAIATSVWVALFILKNIPGSAGVRFALVAVVIGTVHCAMLMGMLKKKKWGFDLIQVMSKLFLIMAGIGVAAIMVAPKLWLPFLMAGALAFIGYKKGNSEELSNYFGVEYQQERLTHL